MGATECLLADALEVRVAHSAILDPVLFSIFSIRALAGLVNKTPYQLSERWRDEDHPENRHGEMLYHSPEPVGCSHELPKGKVGPVELPRPGWVSRQQTPGTLNDGCVRHAGKRGRQQPKVGDSCEPRQSAEEGACGRHGFRVRYRRQRERDMGCLDLFDGEVLKQSEDRGKCATGRGRTAGGQLKPRRRIQARRNVLELVDGHSYIARIRLELRSV